MIKINRYLLSFCCTLVWVMDVDSTQGQTNNRSARWARRAPSLASLVEADVAIESVQTTTESTPPITEVSSIAPEAPPLVAQVTDINDGEDDDYDDLSDEEPEPQQDDQPIQEVIEQVVARGPAGFVVEEKEVIRAPDSAEHDVIEFQFEDADLQNLVKQVSDLFGITFIPDDAVTPMLQTGKAVKGNKISFRTQKPLSRKQAWHLFQTFLDVAGLAIVPLEDSTYRIVKTEAARKSSIPAFIGVKAETLPDSDQMIRFLYFMENISVDTLRPIIEELRSSSSASIYLKEMNAFVLTDKSYNIKSLMNIIGELDRVALPQSMSVLKLRRANAQDVKTLYDTITKTDDKNITARLFPSRKQPTALYFPENVRIIAEPRTNALILLGAQDAIKKIEDFITTYVDVEIGKPHSPLRTYDLKYADAGTIATIMNELTQFGKDTPAGRVGGVRDGDKYMKQMSFTPEFATNRLIIRGEEEDYLKARDILDILDEPQPQVAIEVLIISITIGDTKSLGTLLRSAQPGINGLVGDNVKYQTSGSYMADITGSTIQTNNNGTGVNRLLGNLITIATGAVPGNTLLTFGSDKFGVWGIFNVLQRITDAQLVSNPFLVATNKQKAIVSIGEQRRVVSGIVVGADTNTNSFSDDTATLKVQITPQINSDGMIVLDLEIDIDTFTDQVNLTSATKNTKKIKTSTIVADKEVLALGGLVKNQINNSTNKVPLLGNIPVIGWLFKNRLKTQTKDNLLVLVSSRIIKPERSTHMTDFTKSRVNDYIADREVINKTYEQLDPVQRFFFNEKKDSSEDSIDDFLFDRSGQVLKENQQEVKKERVAATKKIKPKRRRDKVAKRERRRDRKRQQMFPDEPVVPGMMESLAQLQAAHASGHQQQGGAV